MAEQRYAVLIGNNEFPNEKGLAPLRCPPQDVEGLASVLKDSNRGQFQVTQLINQTKQAIETELLRVLNKAQKEDLVLIYFSGHGRQSNLKGRLYLAVKDTGLDLLQATAIAASQIKIFLDEAHCNRIVLILDCCYSGAIDTEFLHKGEQSSQVNQALQELSKDEGHGLHILTASTSIQTATEKQGDRYSVFTKHLIQGIETGAADKHSTGLIRLHELFQYIKEQVKAETTQTPQIFNHGDADLLIAHSGKSSRKQRHEKIVSFLHGLLNDRHLTADIYAEAVRILTKSELELNPSEKQKDLLLDDLCNKEIGLIDFGKKWEKADNIPDKKPDKASKVSFIGLNFVTLTKKLSMFMALVSLIIMVVIGGWRYINNKLHSITTINLEQKKTGETKDQEALQRQIAVAKDEAAKEAAKKHQEQLASIEAKKQQESKADKEVSNTQKISEPKMIAIPAGRFLMGSPDNEKERFKDERQHEVSVKAFYLGQTEVTKGQFSAFVTATHYQTEAEKGDGCFDYKKLENNQAHNWKNVGFVQTDRHPVACVSWNDAMAYIAWLNQETGKSYRLPTEVEWEYAARADTKTPFYSGECIGTSQADFNGTIGYGNCAKGVYKQQTVEVASYAANPLGLFDMAGNVWEWTCSEYDEQYTGQEKQCSGNNNAGSRRVLRGGSWNYIQAYLRSAGRIRYAPDWRGDDVGFRLAQD